MSIYIKGMEMPKEGTVIVIDCTGQVWSNEWPTRGYTRLKNAKAIPVPPHGRLIDADALCKDRVSNDNVVICAKCSPTIIPAEEE